MKKIYKYILVLLAGMHVSCEKQPINPSEEIELIPEAGYINFSTGVVTKAPIIEDMKDKSFGVFGYEYGFSTDWGTARALAEPNLCYNLRVDCADNGLCSYDASSFTKYGTKLMPWELSKKYSFFAYYPMTDAENDPISLSKATDKNMPKVTYSLPISNSEEVDPDNLLDLMTAYSTDMTAGRGMVGFKFQHRLYCIEVLSQNFNTEHQIVNSDNSVTSYDADEYISNLTVTIDNLKYQSITVPMQKGDALTDTTATLNRNGAVRFRLLTEDQEIKVASLDENAGAVSLSGPSGDKLLMLIPQDAKETAMTGHISLTLKDENEKITYYDLPNNDDTVETETHKKVIPFKTNFNLMEGKKYTITINFTGETIVVAWGVAGDWVGHSVKYEFE